RAAALYPAALRKAFTLLEFARLLSGVALLEQPTDPADPADPVERARAVVAKARSMRGRVPYVDPAVDDVADPVRTPEGFRACAASIGPAVRTIVAALCGGAGDGGEPGDPTVPHARAPHQIDVGR